MAQHTAIKRSAWAASLRLMTAALAFVLVGWLVLGPAGGNAALGSPLGTRESAPALQWLVVPASASGRVVAPAAAVAPEPVALPAAQVAGLLPAWRMVPVTAPPVAYRQTASALEVDLSILALALLALMALVAWRRRDQLAQPA